MSPWLSVIVPTIGNPTLGRTLDSIALQAWPDEVEVLVVGDTLDGPLEWVRADAERRGYRYLGYAGPEHCWGQPQRQAGMRAARGRWLHWLADDDIYVPDALGVIWQATRDEPDLPHCFWVVTPWRYVVPDELGLAKDHVDASCIVAPNDQARLGEWGLRYTGDFDFISATDRNYGGRTRIHPNVIVWTRPEGLEDWTRAAAAG
jgi:glycosyltransferase involved in cell wall biosynthesis